MNYSEDLLAINWLKIGEQPVTKGQVFRVANALPDVFEAYIALLPAVGRIEGFPFDQINLGNSSIKQINKNAAVWESYGVYSAHHTPNYKPTTFNELADQFSLPYNITLLNQLDWGKRGFAVDWARTANGLCLLVEVLAAGSTLPLYVEDYWRWAEVHDILPSANDVLYCVTADEFVEFMAQSFFDASLYLFPEDKSWCLVNMEGCSVMVVGADKATAVRIVETYPFETIPLLHESPM